MWGRAHLENSVLRDSLCGGPNSPPSEEYRVLNVPLGVLKERILYPEPCQLFEIPARVAAAGPREGLEALYPLLETVAFVDFAAFFRRSPSRSSTSLVLLTHPQTFLLILTSPSIPLVRFPHCNPCMKSPPDNPLSSPASSPLGGLLPDTPLSHVNLS